MRKLIIILFLIPLALTAQRRVYTDSLTVTGGGTFGDKVVIDTAQVKGVSYATDSLDAVPLGQLQDSLGTATDGFQSVDATNLSNVTYTTGTGSKVYESFAHVHNEYMLTTDVPAIDSFEIVKFYRNVGLPTHRPYSLFADTADNTIGIYIEESDVTGQLMRELWLPNVYVEEAMDNGTVVFIDTTSGTMPIVSKAKADLISTADGVIGLVTHDAEINTVAVVTTNGLVRDVNTSGMIVGDALYLSASTAGGFTNIRPEYPNYVIKLGTVTKVGTTDGEINVNVTGMVEDIIFNAFNGNFLESFDFRTTVTGGAIKGYLERSDGEDYLTMNFSDGFTLLDVSAADTVTLTAGTDTDPQLQYVYILKSTKALTVSTSFWPSAEYIPVAVVTLQSIATTSTNGALRNQNINDHIAGTDGQGHISHMGARIRKIGASWESGTEGSATIVGASSPDDVYVAVTAGTVWQMHLQSYTAKDMQTGDDLHIVNDNTTPYSITTNLNTELTDASGNSMSGKSFSFVIWGVANKTGETSHLMCNLPTGSYSGATDAINDALGYSVYSIPKEFQGVGFLIARFTFSHSASGSGTWTLQDTEDLRGIVPNTSAGGGIGGVGVTTFLGLTDVPNSYSGEGGNIPRVASGETALEFSTPANTIVNGGDSIVLQDEVYDFVTSYLPNKIYKSTVELNSAAVASLGTSPATLITAQGAGTYTNPIMILVYIDVTTTLEVGTQNLEFGHTAGTPFVYVANSSVEGVTNGNNKAWKVYEQATGTVYDIRANNAFYAGFDSGVNPSSGSATMTIVTYYTIETF